MPDGWPIYSYRAVKAVCMGRLCSPVCSFDRQSSNLQLDSKKFHLFWSQKDSLWVCIHQKCYYHVRYALEELAHLSESLQQASISLPKAHRRITREIEILKSRKETGGDYYTVRLAKPLRRGHSTDFKL